MIQPTGDRILVKPLNSSGEQKTPTGIILPETKQAKVLLAEVVGKGEGKEFYDDGEFLVRPVPFSVGQVVAYRSYSGAEVLIDGALFLILQTEEVLGTATRALVNS